MSYTLDILDQRDNLLRLLRKKVEEDFGSWDACIQEIKAAGIALRGWAILGLDIFSGRLVVNGLDAHNVYNYTGLIPLIVHTFLVFAVILLGFFVILTGILTRLFSLPEVLLMDALIIGISLVIIIRAYRIKRLKDKFPPPPKVDTRCPVCGAYIKPQSDYCVLMDSKTHLYFDSKVILECKWVYGIFYHYGI